MFSYQNIVNKEDFIKIFETCYSEEFTEKDLNLIFENLLENQSKKLVECTYLQQKIAALSSLLLDSQYLMTKAQFLSIFMDEWRTYLQMQKIEIMKVFYKYDENGDGVMTLNEFSVLIKDLEPTMNRSQVANLFMKVMYENLLK